jgi:hypothetical protein
MWEFVWSSFVRLHFQVLGEFAYYLPTLYQFQQLRILNNMIISLRLGNKKMFEKSWLCAVALLRKLIEFSQCLCRYLNLKHPEQEFEQTVIC